MTQHLTIASLNARSARRQLLSRRQVMIGAAGLSFAIAVGVNRRAAAAVLASERSGKALSPWVSIALDGTITIMSPATEMGQGSLTSLPLIIAEELDADWSKVRIVPAPTIEAIYGNPGFGGMMYTAGSNAVTSYYRPLRIFGAQVRRVLIDNAAKKLGVPAEELSTEPNTVVHAKSGRKLSYGEIAGFAEVPEKPPEVKPEALKKPSEFRLIGKDVSRVDLPGKVNGSARYAIDVQVPNMLYGAVLRAPVEGSVPDKIDDAKAKVIAGAVKIVRLPYGVGVLADTPWAAFEARRALTQSVTWSRTGTAWGFDSDKGMERFAADAKDVARGATEWSKIGDPRAEMPKASSSMEAEYRCDYAYHAQMEPLNAIASVSPSADSVEIWAGTQSQTTATEAPAKLLGIPREKVKLNDMLMGGGFGRRGNRDVDFIIDAVLLSKEAGRPVKVMWTREDDVQNGRFRPISAHYLKAGFDPSGKLAAWHHRIAVDRVGPYMDPVRYQQSGGKDFIAMLGADLRGYDVPHQLVEQLYRDTGVRTNPLRGRAGGGDGELGQEARGARAGICVPRLFGLASRRHRRSVGRSRQRTNQGARLLVHHRLRRCRAARQRGGPDREQHRLRGWSVVDRTHQHQERCGRAVELLRLSRAAHERGAGDAHRGDRDRQPSDGCRTNGDSADRARDLERGDATHRGPLAPHAVHLGAGQGSVGLDTSGRLAARTRRTGAPWPVS